MQLDSYLSKGCLLYGGSEFSAVAKMAAIKTGQRSFMIGNLMGLCEGVSDGPGFSAVDRLTERKMIVKTGQRRFVIGILMVGVKVFRTGSEFN